MIDKKNHHFTSFNEISDLSKDTNWHKKHHLKSVWCANIIPHRLSEGYKWRSKYRWQEGIYCYHLKYSGQS